MIRSKLYSRPDLFVDRMAVKSRRSQVTIFVILAIVILAGIGIFFYVRSNISVSTIPSDFKPVEESFLACVQDYTRAGVDMLGQNGGYIYLPSFEAGSAYAPSSNMLSFAGTPMPYWYYVAGNNVVKEQVPSKSDMERQLQRYLDENVVCDFSSFEARGYIISLGKISSRVSINENGVEVEVDSDLDMSLEGQSYKISSHNNNINTKLGKFYNEALKVYNYEKENIFLEKFGLDVLYNYAPVTDVMTGCAPEIWAVSEVENEIKQGLEANIAMIKLKGKYYSKADSYFVVNSGTSEAVQFLYSSSWPTRIEVKNDNGFLIAEPVGNQPGLGALGFCYIPVHFVYDLYFPVVIQFYDNNEVFKFPVIAVIQGNKEKNPEPGTYFSQAESRLCEYKNARVDVYTYDTSLEPVEASIGFECFSDSCSIGKTVIEEGQAHLEGYMPQCVNGFITARGEGYKEKRYQISTNEEDSASIILDRLYNVSIDLKLEGESVSDSALVYFESSDYSTSLVWPDQKIVKLADGIYNVTAYVYRNGSITLPETKQNKCVQTPRPGLLGMFGMTKENCFDITIPEQIVSSVISGGGKSQIYLAESDLVKGSAELGVGGVEIPTTIEGLQSSYSSLEDKRVSLDFK